MADVSRISVEIGASSVSLQEAVDKASSALTGLGDVLARQSERAGSLSDRILQSNGKLAASYTDLAGTVKETAAVSTRAWSASADVQMTAGERIRAANDALARAATRTSGVVARSAREQAVAVSATAREQVAAADREVAASGRAAGAYREQAVAAEGSAAKQSAAATVRADASARTGAAAVAAGVKSKKAAGETAVAFGAAGSKLSKAGRDILIGLSAVAVGSVDMAVKFQASTLRLETQAGATAKQLKQLREGLLGMAGETGFKPDQLAQGLYHVVSSMNAMLPRAQRVSGELHVLKIAAEGAQIGGSNLEDTAYALASAMTALHEPASSARKVMGDLNAIVGSGDMKMQDLLDAFKSGLIATAASAHVSLQSIGAALATLGDEGQRGSIAGTRLRMSIALLSSPSEKAAKILDTLGMSSKQATSTSHAMAEALQKAGLRTTSMSADLRKPDGILVALRDLNDHLHSSGLTATGAASVMSAAFGGGKMGETIDALAQQTGRLNAKFVQIGKTGGQFGHDWQLTKDTLRVSLDQMVGSVSALAIKLGTDLMPTVKGLLVDLKDTADWLGHNKTALDALGGAAITFATVAVGSYMFSKLKAMLALMKEFGGGIATVNRWLLLQRSAASMPAVAAASSASGAAGAVGTVERAAGVGGNVWGARGPQAPGSIANPIIVAMEAGEFAGLGSQGAAGTVATEQHVAQAERTAAQGAGVPVPAVGGGGAAEATAAAEGGMFASLRTGMSDLLSKAMRGGLIAGLGTIVSQTVGSVIPGKAGKDVSGIGTKVALGAALGSFLGPEGTLAGGVLGGLVGAFQTFDKSDASKYGDQMAAKFTSGLGSKVADEYHAGLATSIAKAHADQQQAQNVTKAASGDVSTDPFGRLLDQNAKAAKKLTADAKTQWGKAGTTAADALIASLQGIKFPTQLFLTQDFKDKLSQLPPAARDTAAKTMIAWASTLEANGQLPKSQLDGIIKNLESSFPGLQGYLQEQGAQTATVIAQSMTLTQAQGNWVTALENIRTQYGDHRVALNVTSQNIVSDTAQAMHKLQGLMHTGTSKQRQEATAEYDHLRGQVKATFQGMLGDLAAKQASMKATIKAGSHEAAKAASDNFFHLDQAVAAAMSGGLLSTSKGTQLIAKALNDTLKALGAKQISVPAIAGGVNQIAAAASSAFSFGQGGVVQFGQAGDRGRDQIPVSFGGQNIMVGSGEVGVVLTRQQQQVLNARTADMGGLPGMFRKVNAKHYMAAGGYVDPIPGFSLGRTDMGVDANAAPGTPIVAIGDSRLTGVIPNWYQGQPLLNFQLTDGPDAGRYWYVAEQIKPVSEQIGALFKAGQLVARFAAGGTGIEIGWGGNASGSTLAQTSGYGPAAAAGAANAAGAGFHAFLAGLAQGKTVAGGPGATPTIAPPAVTGTGTTADIVRAGLAKVAGAANTRIASVGAGGSTGAMAGVGHLVPGILGIEQQAASIAGLAWNGSVVSELLSKESSGGVNEPPSGSLSATGPNQVIPSTFAQYALPGRRDINNPLDNAIASMRYIKATYGSLAAMAARVGLFGAGYKGYAGGGITAGDLVESTDVVHPVHLGGPHVVKAPKAPKTAKPKVSKPPKAKALKAAPGAIATGMTTKDMQALASMGGKVNSIEQLIASLTGTYQADTTMFAPEEGQPQYLNADGSLNASGYAKKISDDQALLSIDNRLLGAYMSEVPVVSAALSHYLGKDSKLSARVAKDTRGAKRDNATLRADKVTLAGYRKQLQALSKPDPDTTTLQRLKDHIAQLKLSFTARIHGAEANKIRWDQRETPKGLQLEEQIITAEKEKLDSTSAARAAALKQQVLTAEASEQSYGGHDAIVKQGLSAAVDSARATYSQYVIDATEVTKTKVSTATRERERDLRQVVLNAEDAKRAYSGKDFGVKQKLKTTLEVARAKYSEFTLGEALHNAQLAKNLTGAELRLRDYLLSEKPTQAQLEATIQNLHIQKAAAIDPLDSRALTLKQKIQAHAGQVKTDRYSIRQKMSGLATKDAQITRNKQTLGVDISDLKGVLSGAGGGTSSGGVNSSIGLLETVAAKLGTVNWGTGGKFLGIDTTMPGEVISVKADILSLQNDLAAAAIGQGTAASSTTTPASTSTAADQSQLIGLLEQQNAVLAETLALNENQTAAIRGMIPAIPSFDTGGPVLDDTLANVHKGEFVVPVGGALVTNSGGSGGVTLHHKTVVQGDMAALMRVIDSRITHPANVNAVSRQLGRRTQLLAGVPGGR